MMKACLKVGIDVTAGEVRVGGCDDNGGLPTLALGGTNGMILLG